jgi:hypothetical protein
MKVRRLVEVGSPTDFSSTSLSLSQACLETDPAARPACVIISLHVHVLVMHH